MDPFVEVFHNGNIYKTPYSKNGGQRPMWDSSLEILDV